MDFTLGPYDEIGLVIAVVRKHVKPRLGHWLQALGDADNPNREMGWFVLHLPVTTKAACAAGREIWGFPKFVSAIEFERFGSSAKIQLADPDHLNDASRAIMDLSGKLGVGMPGPSMSSHALYITQGAVAEDCDKCSRWHPSAYGRRTEITYWR